MSERNWGECPTFNPEDFIKVAKQLVDADETERALLVLSNIPAYYRDHVPQVITDMKRWITARLVTPHGYLNDDHDIGIMPLESAEWTIENTLRGALLNKEVQGGEQYHIVDMGPGQYWLPIGLKGNYSYKSIGLDLKTKAMADVDKRILIHSNLTPNPVGIFAALEVIEHLPDPRDMAAECAKHFDEEPHYIHLSTPLFTFDPSSKDNAKHLPHLRAYTPKEFIAEAYRLWPHYEWQLYLSPIMSLRGLHPKAKNRQQFAV